MLGEDHLPYSKMSYIISLETGGCFWVLQNFTEHIRQEGLPENATDTQGLLGGGEKDSRDGTPRKE